MDSLLDVVEDGLRDPGVARTSLDLGQTRVVETPQHRVEVIAGDPRALDVKARRLEDPQVWGVVEDGARGQIEKVLDSRGLVQFARAVLDDAPYRSEEHTSELQSQSNLVCRLLL